MQRIDASSPAMILSLHDARALLRLAELTRGERGPSEWYRYLQSLHALDQVVTLQAFVKDNEAV